MNILPHLHSDESAIGDRSVVGSLEFKTWWWFKLLLGPRAPSPAMWRKSYLSENRPRLPTMRARAPAVPIRGRPLYASIVVGLRGI